MRTKLLLKLAALAAVASSAVFSADKIADMGIEAIKRDHRKMCDLSRSGIIAGYLACGRGLDLSNYLAAVEVEWGQQLSNRIAEAKR